MKVMKAMKANVARKSMKKKKAAVGGKAMKKLVAMKPMKATRKPIKSTVMKAMKDTLKPPEFLQAYVLQALQYVINLSRLGHIEGEFTPLLLAELKPAANMVRRRAWEMESTKGKLTLEGTVQQALDYVKDLTRMGHIESDMAPLLLSELESAVSMVRKRLWMSPSH